MEDDSSYPRPRRLDDDTVEYLKQLETPLLSKNGDTDDNAPDLDLLVRNVISELQHKEASAATHRRCSVTVERLLRRAHVGLVAGFMARMERYILFASTNRYASHVLQTIFYILASQLNSDVSNAFGEDAADPEQTKMICTPEEAILTIADAIEPNLLDLMYEKSGTHVVRALICTLAGLQGETGQLADPNMTHSKMKRTRKKLAQKRHASGHAKGRDELQMNPGGSIGTHKPEFGSTPSATNLSQSVKPSRVYEIPKSFGDRLQRILNQIASLSAGQLFETCSDPNASPCLQLLLRAIFVSQKDGTILFTIDQFASLLLQLENGSELLQQIYPGQHTSEQTQSDHEDVGTFVDDTQGQEEQPEEDPADIIEQLSKHNVASHIVEACIQLASDELYQLLVRDVLRSRIGSLSTHAIANFVVQQILLCARSGTQVEDFLHELLPLVPQLFIPRFEGVLWSLVSAAAKTVALPAKTLEDEDEGSTSVETTQSSISEAMQRAVCKKLIAISNAAQKNLRKQQTKRTQLEKSLLTNPVAWWLDLGHQRTTLSVVTTTDDAVENDHSTHHSDDVLDMQAVGTGSDLIISHTGARIVAALLCFQPSAARSILENIVSLPSQILYSLAVQSWGSRNVLEPILAGPEEFEWAKTKLCTALSGQWASLACDRSGCWLVQKAFAALSDVEKKKDIVNELLNEERKIQGSRQGRYTALAVKLDHFKRDEASWESSIRNDAERAAMFDDILSNDQNTSKKSQKAKKAEKRTRKDSTDKSSHKRTKVKRSEETTDTDVPTRLDPFIASLGYGADAAAAAVAASGGGDDVDQTDKDSSKPKHKKKTKKTKKSKHHSK